MERKHEERMKPFLKMYHREYKLWDMDDCNRLNEERIELI